MTFANLADAGRQLARLVVAAGPWPDPMVVAAIPNGVPVALPVARALGVEVTPLPIERTDAGPLVHMVPDVAGRTVLVIDDGVETGSVARAAAAALAALRPTRLVLAVPVCSREAEATMQRLYDQVVAVDRPMGRRALAWHFDDFDTIDEFAALALLAEQEPPAS